jgi:hypothetical protein
MAALVRVPLNGLNVQIVLCILIGVVPVPFLARDGREIFGALVHAYRLVRLNLDDDELFSPLLREP